jgi:conjugal transfer pilus assembly protein TraL
MSSINESQLKMPTHVDNLPKFLFWDFDQFSIVIFFFGLGIISKQLLTLTAFGLFLAWMWQKFKSGKHQWFLLHGMKWFLPMSSKSNRIPNTGFREFLR